MALCRACSYVAEKIQKACCGQNEGEEVKGIHERECKLAGKGSLRTGDNKGSLHTPYGEPVENGTVHSGGRG